MHEDVVRALDIPRKREILDVSTIDFRELLVGKISNPTLLQTLDRLVKERSDIDGGPTSNRATAPGAAACTGMTFWRRQFALTFESEI